MPEPLNPEPTPPNLPGDVLPKAAERVYEAMRQARFAQVLARRGDSAQASEAATTAADEAALALTLLKRAGAVPPRFAAARDASTGEPTATSAAGKGNGLDLGELARMDSPDLRALLALLEDALPIAERIDAARGRALDEVVGGSAGFDLAEDLVQIIARLKLELFGPSERVTGGRE